MSEKFCLRWNDFETSISSAFKEIREEKDFFDVTLACDSDQIQAHKVILSACSPFFRNILKRNRHEHPLLYMKDISLTNLSCVLNFMYHGEVNVAQEDLNSFLAVAEELKVKGLTQKNDDETKTLKRTETSRPAAGLNGSRKYNSKSTPVAHAKAQVREDDDIQEVLPIKTEPTSVMEVDTGVVAMPQEQQEVYEETGEYGDYGYEETGADYSSVGNTQDGNQEDQRKAISNMIWERIAKLGTGQYQCTECGITKNSSGLTALKNHVEAKHLTNLATYTCPHCSKVLSTSNAYNQHL